LYIKDCYIYIAKQGGKDRFDRLFSQMFFPCFSLTWAPDCFSLERIAIDPRLKCMLRGEIENSKLKTQNPPQNGHFRVAILALKFGGSLHTQTVY
jgi:hypothetical protein